jgi:chromate transporter
VLGAFLKLGLTSFGGPVAHLGYFRSEFVERRRWLDDRRYSDLVALCQFLPGPASSQAGMALGLGRAGWPGALAAWIGFTLPPAVALILFAFGIAHWAGLAQSGVVHGLKVMAVAVVAQAVWGMAKSLCPDRLRGGIAIAAALLCIVLASSLGQMAAIVLGGLLGWRLLPLSPAAPAAPPDGRTGRTTGALLLGLFALLLVGLPALAALSGSLLLSAVAACYQAGSLVFGGGHVVLPCCRPASCRRAGSATRPSWPATARRRRCPARCSPSPPSSAPRCPRRPAGGSAALRCCWPSSCPPSCWSPAPCRTGKACADSPASSARWAASRRRRRHPRAALHDPVWTSAIHTNADFALALAAYGLLVFGRLSPVFVVALAALGRRPAGRLPPSSASPPPGNPAA